MTLPTKQDQCADAGSLPALAPEVVKAAVRGLTRAERRFVERGCIHGDFRMSTVSNLQGKGIFYLKIESPNGRAGFMRLTPLGLAAQALIKDRSAALTRGAQ